MLNLSHHTTMQHGLEHIMPPLWLRFPKTERHSSDWLSDDLDAYVKQFNQWYATLTVEARQKYQNMFPEPKVWHGYYALWDNQLGNDEIAFQPYQKPEHWQNAITLWSDLATAKYDLAVFQKQIELGKHFRYFYFDERLLDDMHGNQTPAYFSPHFFTPISDYHADYANLDQYIVGQKMAIFEPKDGESIRDKIALLRTAEDVQRANEKIKNFNQAIWNIHEYSVLLNGNYQKFHQNEKLRDLLLATHHQILVYATDDLHLGVGLHQGEQQILDPLQWRGKNLLGFALMEVRDELARVWQFADIIDWKKYQD